MCENTSCLMWATVSMVLIHVVRVVGCAVVHVRTPSASCAFWVSFSASGRTCAVLAASSTHESLALCDSSGNTLTGAFDPIEEISKHLTTFNKEHGTDIAIHVDGASGA